MSSLIAVPEMRGCEGYGGTGNLEMSDTAELENSENKTSLSEWKEAAISLAAFATSKGGTVHFGIDPDGKRVGIQLGKNSLENLANDIKRHTDPPVFPSIQVEGGEASAIVHVSVEESPIKPVWAFGKPYKRVGRTNQSLSREETLRLVETTTGRTWDALPCPGLKEEHLSRSAIEDFLKRCGQDISIPTQVVLDNLHLRLPDGTLCNAAALLFTDTPGRYIIEPSIKCGRFRGDLPVEFIDEVTADVPLFAQLDTAVAFIAKNTRNAIKITGKPQHERVSEYPDLAIREAVINAICHRNYTESGHTQIRIFHSGLEVWNPGTLPHDLSIASLYAVHGSRPRNRLIASAFHRAGLIEHWGTGTLRILQACEERNMKRPEFRAEMGTFIVRFESPEVEPLKSSAAQLTERQRKCLDYVRKHGAITSPEYQKLFGVKERQARRDLGVMVEQVVLAVEGKGPSRRYVMAG